MILKRTGKKIYKKEKGRWIVRQEGKSAAHAKRMFEKLLKAGAKEE